MKGKHHSENRGVDEWIILKRILWKYGFGIWIGLLLLGMATGSGFSGLHSRMYTSQFQLLVPSTKHKIVTDFLTSENAI